MKRPPFGADILAPLAGFLFAGLTGALWWLLTR